MSDVDYIPNAQGADEESINIALALSGEYVNIFLVDVVASTIRAQKIGTSVMEDLGYECNVAYPFDEFLAAFSGNRTHPDDVADFRETFKVDRIAANIEGLGEYDYNFRILANGKVGHFNARFVPLENTDYVIVGLRCTDSLIAEELDKRNKMRADLLRELDEYTKIVDVLAGEYSNVYKIYPEDETIEAIKQEALEVQEPGSRVSYNDSLEFYITTAIPPENVDAFRTMMSLPVVIDELRRAGNYTATYRSRFRGRNYVRFRYSKMPDGNILLGFMDVTREYNEETARVREMHRNNSILSALTDDVTHLYILDPLTKKVEIRRQNNDVAQVLGDIENDYEYETAWRGFTEFFVHPDDRARIYRLGHVDTVLEELKEHGSVEYNYMGLTSNSPDPVPYQIEFQLIADDEIMISGRDISSIVEKEEQIKRLEEAYAITDALTLEFENSYMVDLQNDTYEILRHNAEPYSDIQRRILERMDEHAKMPYQSTIASLLIETCLTPEDAEETIYAMSIEQVLKNLAERREYLVSYRQIIDGAVRNKQAQFVRLDDDRVILGVRNVDHIIAEEARQRAVVEDALAAAEHANRAKTAFLNNMSHDIRTPMNAIIGFSTLASSHLDDREKVGDYLQKIRSSSDHLLSLINDVLDMSRIESGKAIIEEQEISLSGILQEIQDILQGDIAAKSLEASFDLTDVDDDYVWCDKLRLTQIIINCLSNAIKFTPEHGAVGVKVIQTPCALSGYASYDIKIHDTGIGMSEEFTQRIFEPFEREHTSTVSGTQGTGLGMAITKNIVDLMGGVIAVQSEKGVGTEFTISLTLRKATAHVEQQETEPVDLTALEGLKILLVEDNELNREIAVELLHELGMTVECAEDGSIAVDMIERCEPGDYDLILMDIQMPIMNGYEATRRIRDLDDVRRSSIPIIALSADAFEGDRRQSLAVGMNGHVAKPIELDKLIKAIQRAVVRPSC